MSRVTLRGVTRRYGDTTALHPLDLEVRQGEFLTLLGPSGCGKTTTLRLIAGFVRPSEGTIFFDEQNVTALAPHARQIGMVFQDYALFPHMTVAENIGFGLVEQRRPKPEISARVSELLTLIRLPAIGQRYPSELSGGQQQRVAVARAVAHAPKVLLMDEPLGALDLKLREVMQEEIRALQQVLGITTIYVTHDQHEAMTMSDRIAVMNAGRLEQCGTASEIYDRPATKFVAGFLGQINLLPQDTATIGVRPEHIRLVEASSGGLLGGTLTRKQFLGNVVRLEIDAGLGAPILVDLHPDQPAPGIGQQVHLAWDPARGVILPS
jgi:ABC-type Fe3+/spermidine/putrescine transport system ATPase subunit